MRYKKKQESVRAYDRIVKTVCGECMVGCGLKFFLYNSQVVDITGDEDHPINRGSLCPRGARIMENLYSNDNIVAQYPVFKSGFTDRYQRTSWDNGINYVADKLEAIKNKFGKDALTVLVSSPNDFFNHYLGLQFAKFFGTNKAAFYDPMKPASELAKCVLGGDKGALSNPPHDWLNSKVIIILGSEIASEVILMGYLLDAKERGAKIVCVDTKYSPVMMKSDYPIIIKPGTFHFLLQGILSNLIGKGLYDNSILERWTEGFSEVVRASFSYNQDDISAKCSVQPETISSLGYLLSKNHPFQIIGAIRDDQVGDADDMARLAWMSIALLAVNNSIGVKGGGWNWLGTGAPPVPWNIEKNAAPSSEAKLLQDYEFLLKEIIEKEECKALIWDGYIPDEITGKELINALSKLKLIVHLSNKKDIAQKYAHVSFPVTNWLEEEGLAFTHYRSIQWQPKVTKTLGERKPAGLFWQELGSKMGYEELSSWKNKANSLDTIQLANFYVKNTSALSGLSSLNIKSFETGGILWPCVDEEKAVFEHRAQIKGRWLLYRYDAEYPGTARYFPTPSGKIELLGKDCKAGWGLTPFRPLNSEPQQPESIYTYSLVICSAPGFLGNTGYEINGRYVIGINPEVARDLGIKDGDMLVLERENKATLKAPAWVTKKIAITTLGLVDVEEPSYYTRFCYRGGWAEGTRVRIANKER